MARREPLARDRYHTLLYADDIVRRTIANDTIYARIVRLDSGFQPRARRRRMLELELLSPFMELEAGTTVHWRGWALVLQFRRGSDYVDVGL